MRHFVRFAYLLAFAASLRASYVEAASRLYGDQYTFSGMNFPGNVGITEDPVTREVVDHGTDPITLTFDGVEEIAGGMKINERAVEWPGLPGGFHVFQDASRDGLTEFDLVDWELPGEVVEFSFRTVNGTWVSGDETAHSAVTLRDLTWANSDAGSIPEFYTTGFYLWYSQGGVGVEGYSTQLPEIGLFAGPHPFDPSVPEVFYIGYSNGQVNEITQGAYEGGVDLTFGTTQLDENDASWALLADVMNVANIVGSADGFHIGFLVAPPLGTDVVIPGDLNDDGQFNSSDLDELGRAIRESLAGAKYDLNSDGAINSLDRDYLVGTIADTYLGDANLDGEFNSGDFVFVFQAGQYEDGVANNSVWATGDWNGDTEFDSGDFVTAFQAGGYEVPRGAVAGIDSADFIVAFKTGNYETDPVAAVVPEPSTLVLLSLGGLIALLRRNR